MKVHYRTTFGLIALSALFAAGCSSAPPRQDAAIEMRAKEIAAQEKALDERRAAIAIQQRALQDKIVSLEDREVALEQRAQGAASRVPAAGFTPTAAQGPAMKQAAMDDEDQLPPNAKPGECYARVFVPPQYTTTTEQLLKRTASSKVEVIPARYAPATEDVLVRPAAKKIEVVPATYEWIEERVMVKPATTRLVEVPAVMETVTEQVLVRAGYTTWKKGTGPIQRIDEATGEIMCLVEVPPEYKTVTKVVEKQPATVREVEVPAEYTTVRKQVLKHPATTREIEIPAEFKTVSVNKLVSPAREVKVPLAPEYQTVSRTEMVAPGRVEWRSILCETNMTRNRIMDIQRALKVAGFNPGPIDGIVQTRTMAAVNAYQRSKGLPVDEYLNVETVQALRVSLN